MNIFLVALNAKISRFMTVKQISRFITNFFRYLSRPKSEKSDFFTKFYYCIILWLKMAHVKNFRQLKVRTFWLSDEYYNPRN